MKCEGCGREMLEIIGSGKMIPEGHKIWFCEVCGEPGNPFRTEFEI